MNTTQIRVESKETASNRFKLGIIFVNNDGNKENDKKVWALQRA